MSAGRGAGAGTKFGDGSNSSLKGSGGRFGDWGVPNDPMPETKPSTRKYHNVPTTVDGHRFDSKKEAARYADLSVMERGGGIRDLEVHPRFPLVVHDIDCGVYVADFAYITRAGVRVIEDVKSAATRKLPTYRLKARLVWAIYGLRITEI